MRAQLLSAVGNRLDAVVNSGDPAGIFTGDAAGEIEQLLGFLTNADGLDIEVLYTLGVAHWLRAVTGAESGRTETMADDESRAMVFLLPLYLQQPDGLPDPVRASLAAATELPEPVAGERKHDLAEALSNLAMLLLTRFAAVGGTDGPAAASLLRRAAFDLPSGHPSHALVLCNLGYAILLTDIVPRLADPQAPQVEPPRVDEVIALFRTSLGQTTAEHDNYARCGYGLGQALRAKAILAQDVAVLGEAIACFRTAVSVPGVPDDTLAQMHTDLGTSLLMLGGQVGDADSAVLPEARAALQRAVRLTPAAGDELTARLTNLIRAVVMEGSDVPGLRRMLDDPGAVPVERALLQGILGESLLEGGDPGARADEAVILLRAAVDGLPPGDARTSAGASLTKAMLLRTPAAQRRARRQELAGDVLADMFGAADSGEQNLMAIAGRMLGLDAEGGDSRHSQLMDFARQLLSSSDDGGLPDVMAAAMRMFGQQVEHLDPAERAEAIQRLISDTPPDSVPQRPPLRDSADLAEIEAVYARLDRELPADHEDRTLLGASRAQARMVRMMHPDGPPTEDRLDEMAAMIGEMRGGLPDMVKALGEAAGMMDSLVVMGPALMSPFDSLAAIDGAIRTYRARGDGVAARTALAHSLFERYSLTSDESDFAEAAALARRLVAGAPLADPHLAMHWGQIVVARAHQTGSPDPDGGSTTVARLASNHVAELIEGFDAPGALESLEDGRSTMLSHALNRRSEVDGLRRIDPELADEFVTLRDEIAANVNPGRERIPGTIERFRERARKFDTIVTRIKALPGFDRFLWPLPLGLDDLRPAGAEGPVVSINVHPRRCDALVLGPAGVRVVPLPELRAQDVIDQVDAFHTAIAVIARGGPLAAQANDVVVGTLGWLWTVVAEPVLTAVGCTTTPAAGQPWPRLWWSPTGPLNFLPLHAAGLHDVPGQSVLDRVVSSYTPTLRALLLSRSHPVGADRTAFAVAMPRTPGYADLPATPSEVAALADRVPTVTGPAATRAAVLAALPDARVAHFACHAIANQAEPSESHLVLTDGPLRITEIGRLQLRRAELAYLSACATARGGSRLADEAIHVASAFQLAGYGQVVATLWEVEDTAAAEVAARFYARLAAAMRGPDRLPAALALHNAVREQRANHRDQPASWAAHLHAGA